MLFGVSVILWLLFATAITAVYADTVKKKLVYSSLGNVGPLNPHLYSPNQMFGQAMVYEPLVRYVSGFSLHTPIIPSCRIFP